MQDEEEKPSVVVDADTVATVAIASKREIVPTEPLPESIIISPARTRLGHPCGDSDTTCDQKPSIYADHLVSDNAPTNTFLYQHRCHW
jgi:hypothetical protein